MKALDLRLAEAKTVKPEEEEEEEERESGCKQLTC